MNAAEEELDSSRFLRIHRSIIVATDRIKFIRSSESGGHLIEIANGVELRSSRPYTDAVNALLR